MNRLVMLAGLTGVILLPSAFNSASTPPTNRAEFYAAMSKLEDKMPASQVRRILGPPDDIISGEAFGSSPGTQLWNYGTDKHGGIPTLGQIRMENGRLDRPFLSDEKLPPYKQLMPEAQLRRVLRQVGGEDRGKFDETAWLVRTANTLIDLGPVKTKFVFDEYRRDILYAIPDNTWQVNCLMRLVFDVPNPPGYPKEKPNAFISPLKPHFQRDTRFPMIVFHDIPFEINYGTTIIAGAPFGIELSDYRNYPIRTTRLHPPDDPLLACEELIASNEWPFPAHNKSDERFAIPYKEQEGDSDDVDATVDADCKKSGVSHRGVARFIDAKTGAVIDRIGCGRELRTSGSNGATQSDEARFVNGPWLDAGYSGYGHGITLPLGSTVRVEWVTRNRVLRGPILKP